MSCLFGSSSVVGLTDTRVYSSAPMHTTEKTAKNFRQPEKFCASIIVALLFSRVVWHSNDINEETAHNRQ